MYKIVAINDHLFEYIHLPLYGHWVGYEVDGWDGENCALSDPIEASTERELHDKFYEYTLKDLV